MKCSIHRDTEMVPYSKVDPEYKHSEGLWQCSTCQEEFCALLDQSQAAMTATDEDMQAFIERLRENGRSRAKIRAERTAKLREPDD